MRHVDGCWWVWWGTELKPVVLSMEQAEQTLKYLPPIVCNWCNICMLNFTFAGLEQKPQLVHEHLTNNDVSGLLSNYAIHLTGFASHSHPRGRLLSNTVRFFRTCKDKP